MKRTAPSSAKKSVPPAATSSGQVKKQGTTKKEPSKPSGSIRSSGGDTKAAASSSSVTKSGTKLGNTSTTKTNAPNTRAPIRSTVTSSVSNQSKVNQASTRSSKVVTETTKKNDPRPTVKPFSRIAALFERTTDKEKGSLQKRDGVLHTRDKQSSLHPIFIGDVETQMPQTTKLVRIFTSSTFTDTMHERNLFLEKAYPRIKTFCLTRGYDFQVVDMRWGVRDEATDDHMGTDLCLKEIQQCQKLSTGPNFVTLLSHKYGYRELPRLIEADEFEKLLKVISSKDTKALLNKWYLRDDNATPPVYVLQSISKHIPGFSESDADKKTEAKTEWWETNSAMQDALYTAATNALGTEAATKYLISVTEKEIKSGLLSSSSPAKSCVWFRRNIKNLDKQDPSRLLSRYTECLGPQEKLNSARDLMKKLKEKLAKVLTSSGICSYDIDWTDKGVDPDNADHKKYLNKIVIDLETKLCDMIGTAINERKSNEFEGRLFEECFQHLKFSLEKSSNFYGRTETMEKIQSYLSGKADTPMIIHGASGCGKTSIVAMAVKQARQKLKNAVVVPRFIGTTPDSSDIASLLSSLSQQIKLVYNDKAPTPDDVKDIILEFQRSLTLATNEKPLVILLDSLDQLDPSHQARQLSWLPQALPPNVRMLLSTLDDDVYQCFPNLKGMFPPGDTFVAVPEMTLKDAKGIIDRWFVIKKRKLTTEQYGILVRSFTDYPLPLNLKLSFDESCRWTSYSEKSSTILQTTVRNSINRLFFRLEKLHGEKFVSRAIGFLTTAKSGLSEGELEDILACDDETLNDIYTYWTPPLRRLPPLLLVRLKADLQEYLVNRGADGISVLYWYHRQFIEAARARYCSTEDIQRNLHQGLADYFNGTWADGAKKPYKDKEGKTGEADRFVSTQPLLYGTTYNTRKLNNQPYHRTKGKQLHLLKEECLCNIEFLLCKLLATSERHILDDFELALSSFKDDDELGKINEALQLSQHALQYDPYQIVTQLRDRLIGTKETESFLKQLNQYPYPYLKPRFNTLTKPGGPLVYALTGHTACCRGLDVHKDAMLAVSNSEPPDETVKLWNIKEGKLLKSFEGLGPHPKSVKFIVDGSLILVQCKTKIVVITHSGDTVYSLDLPSEKASYCVGGKGQTVLAIFHDSTVNLHEAKSGKKLCTVTHHDKTVEFEETGITAGSDNFIAVTAKPKERFTILDLNKQTFSDVFVVSMRADVKYKHVIKSFVITPDEKHVLYSIKFENDLRFVDIAKLKETQFIEGDKSDHTGGQFCQSPDGQFLMYPVAKYICSWNIYKQKHNNTYHHPCYVHKVVSVDWKTMVTIGNDPIVRIWDITRETGSNNKRKMLGLNIQERRPLSNSRYLAGLTALRRDHNSLTIHDLCSNDAKRIGHVEETPRVFELLNDQEAIVCNSKRRLKVIDLDSMTVKRTFQGKMFKHIDYTLYDYCELVLLYPRQEVAVATRGRRHLKVYDMVSGKVKSIIKTPKGAGARLKNLQTNTACNIVIGFSDVETIFVFDIPKSVCKMALKIPSEDYDRIASLSVISNGKIAAIQTFKRLPDGSEFGSVFLWDITGNEGKKIAELKDTLYVDTEPIKNAMSFCAVVNMDDKAFITSHEDNIIRVWDPNNGKLIERLYGHTSEIYLVKCDGGPYFLSNSLSRQENAFRVWDKKTFECVASFKLEGSETFWMEFCADKKSLFSIRNFPIVLNHWTLPGTENDVELEKYPELFKGSKDTKLILSEDRDDNEDKNDPDDDIDEEDEFED